MVGKGVEPKSSRIFHQCYLKCCKLQNLTPLTNVIPGGNGKVLDFCVDRLKYQDWPPILNALSCDLSLHSVAVKCRQPVKTVLEHIDCDRLAKTVNKRSVILTNFMLNNLVEATSQLLRNTTLLTSLLLEGLPVKIPYLNPLCEAVLANTSLQHLSLPRCLIGDAGCLAVCKAVRCLPNILTLDLSGCELTPLGAGYIADLVKYQKIHRYSENWVHTLRYRLPELDTMAGLRRLTVCGNPQLGDAGVGKLLDVLADDLWIKVMPLDEHYFAALDAQNCGLTEQIATSAQRMLQSNTTLVVLDLRHNEVCSESLATVRVALRDNGRGLSGQYSWLASSGSSSDGRSVKYVATKNGVTKDRVAPSGRTVPNKYANKSIGVKKEKDYAETLEEQLNEEVSHRQQLEELNSQLVLQVQQLKQQQLRLWTNAATSSGSEQSLQASSRSGALSSSSGSSGSVPIDQTTLSYIQQAFKDIYAFIKNNQCSGHEATQSKETIPSLVKAKELDAEDLELTEVQATTPPARAHSCHGKIADATKMNKATKSAHLLGDVQLWDILEMKPDMIERQMGDTNTVHNEEQNGLAEVMSYQTAVKSKKSSTYDSRSPCSSTVSDSSDTLVCPAEESRRALALNPRDAFYSSDDDSS